jgi:type I restriction enzyme S subunit
LGRANGRRKVTLGEVADVSWGDTSTTKSSYTDTGFPAYSASGQDGYLPYADFDRFGVILSAIGANCGKTWLAKGQWSCIKNTIRFWSTDAAVDTEFLYWKTRNPEIWPKRGSAQPFISQGDARALQLELPPLPEQRVIAHILGTLDDKIELNRRMNQTLEEMARALFKSWFVDFDPVRAKMTGRWRPGQSLPGLPRNTTNSFLNGW